MSLASSSYSYPLLGVFWTILEIFLFVLWIWILIYVFIDIFRRHDLPGWAKALWFILILFIPLIGVVMYLIARGGEMAFFKNTDPAFRMHLLVAIGAYSVSAIFGLAFLLTRIISPHTSLLIALGVAIGAAAPLALALLWGRLTSLKIGPVQIDIKQIAVTSVSLDLGKDALPGLFTDVRREVTEKVLELIEAPDTKLLQVNLHAEPYWWPSRLFFLAALLDDYTDIRRVVFVAGDARNDYVGMARPEVIRRCIAAAKPEFKYDEVYRRADAATGLIPTSSPDSDPTSSPDSDPTSSPDSDPTSSPDSDPTSSPDSDPRQERLRAIGPKWKDAYHYVFSGQEEPWPDTKQLVDAQELRRLLGAELNTTSIEWDGGPGTTLDYYRILDHGEEFVALTSKTQLGTGQPRLEEVVSVCRMATDISRQVLRKQLEGAK
jgi:phospholipase D-like protein